MRKAWVFIHQEKAALFSEIVDEKNKSIKSYTLIYEPTYTGQSVSLTLPTGKKYSFESFPTFFEGLLPEGAQLEALLRQKKIDRRDYFSQLLAVGADMVGAVTVQEVVE